MNYWLVGNEKSSFYTLWCGSSFNSKGGKEVEEMKKGQYEQSCVLASSTHKSTPKPADLQSMVENCEGEDLNYNTAYQKVQEVNQVEMMVAAKSLNC